MADVTSQFVMLLQLLSTITFVEAMMDPASTPPMGWRSWNAFLDDINQTIIEGQVDAIATGGQEGKSLVSYGYNRVGIDGGWVCQNTIGSTGCTCGGVGGSYHDKDGHPVVGLERFPDLGALVTYAHSKGVKLDWYGNSCNCANNEWKQWGVQGGNPINDVKAMAKYGFDGIKIDGCSPAHNISLWVEQLAALQGVPLLLENCGDNGVPTVPGQHVPWSVPNPENLPKSGACGFQMYRISADIAPQFNSIMANLQSSVVYRNHSRPGCWAYPDMLQVGNPKLSIIEAQTHFAAWCISSSPLVLGYDLRKSTKSVLDIVTNQDAINVNQDWNGDSGAPMLTSSESFVAPVNRGAYDRPGGNVTLPVWQIWAKTLSKGAKAVLIMNIEDDKSRTISFDLGSLKLSGNTVKITEIFSKNSPRTMPNKGNYTSSVIQPHASEFLLIEPV
eukprot:m.212155 g.212155  ORF g.212155 m.212155 type:complete len:445 (-) comp15848_c0_seq8:31-1365(-)